MSILSADDITQAEHYTKKTEVKGWLIYTQKYLFLKSMIKLGTN